MPKYEVSSEDIHEAVNGICLACGEIAYGGVEPDACGYECKSCGVFEVCGLEEAILIGRITVMEGS